MNNQMTFQPEPVPPGQTPLLGAGFGGAVQAFQQEAEAKYARTMGMFGGPRVRQLPPGMRPETPMPDATPLPPV